MARVVNGGLAKVGKPSTSQLGFLTQDRADMILLGKAHS